MFINFVDITNTEIITQCQGNASKGLMESDKLNGIWQEWLIQALPTI